MGLGRNTALYKQVQRIQKSQPKSRYKILLDRCLKKPVKKVTNPNFEAHDVAHNITQARYLIKEYFKMGHIAYMVKRSKDIYPYLIYITKQPVLPSPYRK